MSEARVITESLGGGPLTRSLLAGETPAHWLEPRPRTPAEWTTRVAAVRADAPKRDWLTVLSPALDARGAAADRLRRVAEGRGVVVTTGQQPGLFGGPIYTWSKAISALALADELERATGVAVAPVFWAATDDADLAEASSTTLATATGADVLTAISIGPDGAPASRVPLGDVGSLLERLARASGSASYREPLDAARDAYRAGATVGSAYLVLLRRLLEPLGITVLDASHEATLGAASPILRSAQAWAADIDRALSEREREIVDGGFTPQVPRVDGRSLVFRWENGIKRRLTIGEDVRGDGPLSANVLLRPVVERALLPTVAYVAGPAELAYFAQVSAVAAALGAQAPLAVPRWSTTILEPQVERALQRLGLAAGDLRDPHAAEGRLAREAMSARVAARLQGVRDAIDQGLGALAGEAGNDGLGTPRIVEGARMGMRHRVERLERRLVAAVKRRESETMRELSAVRGALWPNGSRQERALNFLPILARQGAELFTRMRGAAAEHARTIIGVDQAGPTGRAGP